VSRDDVSVLSSDHALLADLLPITTMSASYALLSSRAAGKGKHIVASDPSAWQKSLCDALAPWQLLQDDADPEKCGFFAKSEESKWHQKFIEQSNILWKNIF